MNKDKLKGILYSRKRSPSVLQGLIFDNTPIDIVDQVTHLGIIFDSKLTWKYHIEHITSKANDSLYSIHLLKFKVSCIHLLTYYKSFIRPIFEYGITVWGNCGITKLLELDKIQYQAMRSITGAMKGSSKVKLFNFLGLYSFDTRYQLQTVSTIRKIFLGNVPSYLSDIMLQYRPQEAYQLRHQFNLKPTNRLYSSFFEKGIRIWNNLPDELRGRDVSVITFKRNVLEHWNISIAISCPITPIDRRTEIHLNRILLDFSQLRSDLFKHNLIDDNLCPVCNNMIEDFRHFFFSCTRYTRQRVILLDSLHSWNFITTRDYQNPSPIALTRCIKNLLNSKNCPQNLFLSLQTYIKSTNRF